MMSFLKSNATLMLAIALLFTGLSMILGPVMAQQQSAPTVAVPADPISLLTTGAPQSSGYTDRLIGESQQRAKANPADYDALSRLGLAYLQKSRETNDPTYYSQAEAAFKKALELKADDYNALAGIGSLELSRHRFSDALEWGKKAQAVRPHNAFAYGVIGDAYNELGRYQEAVDTFQQMVNVRPDQASYSRVSYARELHGDIAGAIEAMQEAISAGGPAAENTAWCRVQLGNLHFNSNRLQDAEREYGQALNDYPNYLHGLAALAQLRWAQGKSDEALKLYNQVVNDVPLPQYVAALGDLYANLGDTENARKQYELVMFVYKTQENGGVDVGIEKALYMADHNTDLPAALALAEKAAQTRQDVHTLDSYAWVLYKSGRYQDALVNQQKAMRLKSQNPLFFYHLGMIYDKLGDSQNARVNIQRALDLNPHFSILHAQAAQAFVKK
jgi:tetratricopeptide (TPR) repeat protein